MRQQQYVVALAAARWAPFPGEVAALAHAENAAQGMNWDRCFRQIKIAVFCQSLTVRL